MLNSHKLLYLLPDVAYIAELLPTKKDNTFAIHAFRQINGEFMTDDEQFITENIAKLFSKIEAAEYQVVLPDFLFTNTIINVSASSDTKIASYLKDDLLPSLELSTKSHLVSTTKLTEFKGTAKVQLSALEKSLIVPLQVAAADNDIKLTSISPLSWTIKSTVSLEPSISVLQIGTKLYTAFHYIGVDQATITSTEDVEPVIETIKTLKGAEPSIQTIYLLSNSLIEEDLKEKLSDVLPLQQLASFKEDNSEMPSYVKHIIESGMRTLSIEDFPVPKFKVAKPTEDDRKIFEELMDGKVIEKKEEEPKEEKKYNKEEDKDIPKPVQPQASSKPTAISLNDEEESETEDKEEEVASAGSSSIVSSNHKIDLGDDDEPDEDKEDPTVAKEISLDDDDEDSEKPVDNSEESDKKEETNESREDTDVDLEQFAQRGETKPKEKKDKPIKNKSGVAKMLKMIFIAVAVFFLTVAIGIGVGMFVLNLAENSDPSNQELNTPQPTSTVPTAAPTPAPDSTESASLSEDFDGSELDILIVNATTKAGYAGGFKTKIDEAGVNSTKASNAKGEYEPGVYVLMGQKDDDVIEFLTEATGLDLEHDSDQATEDPSTQYDAVIVLAQ